MTATLPTKRFEVVPIDSVRPHPQNPRRGNVDAIAQLIRANGFRGALVVQRSTGYILAGNHRWLAAKKAGLKEIPVVWEDCDDETALRHLLADNRSSDLAEWHQQALAELLEQIAADQGSLDGTGFSAEDLDELLAAVQKAGHGADADDREPPAPPERPVSAPGDLWLMGAYVECPQCGAKYSEIGGGTCKKCGAALAGAGVQYKHRLLVGDATRQEDVSRLMGAERAQLAFLDPPYGVDYEGYTSDRLKIQGDSMPLEQFSGFLCAAFACLRSCVLPTASVYVCHASRYQREFQNALEAAGFEIRNQIIWAKHTFAWGHGRYKFQHEPIFYCHVRGEDDPWYGDKSQSTLWQEKKPSANRLHPTMKPVELVERALLNSSRRGDLVVDLFAGSGSTLIACEKLGRRARLMEIDPKYADVIVRRWQEFTGRRAVLDGDGRCFDELAAERRA